MDDALKKYGFFFKKKYGQNFLADKNLLRAIAEDSGADKDTTVLEIGAGAGGLTRALCACAKRVVAYEIDVSLKPVLAETLSGCENAEVMFRDFAKEDLKALEGELGEYIVAANLPYYLTTPLLLRFAEESETCKRLTVMIQEEVAERFCAAPGTPAYGAATAAMARRGSCALLRKIPRTMFTPRPNVDSALVRFDFQSGGFEVLSAKWYRYALRCAFGNRRKTLVNNLMSSFSLSREKAEGILGQMGLDRSIRGEVLSPEQLGKLSDLLSKEQSLAIFGEREYNHKV